MVCSYQTIKRLDNPLQDYVSLPRDNCILKEEQMKQTFSDELISLDGIYKKKSLLEDGGENGRSLNKCIC